VNDLLRAKKQDLQNWIDGYILILKKIAMHKNDSEEKSKALKAEEMKLAS